MSRVPLPYVANATSITEPKQCNEKKQENNTPHLHQAGWSQLHEGEVLVVRELFSWTFCKPDR